MKISSAYTHHIVMRWDISSHCDEMGYLSDRHDSTNNVTVVGTHDEDGEEYSCIEPWCDISLEWFNKHKSDPNLRDLINQSNYKE